jgi:hypothetical protein
LPGGLLLLNSRCSSQQQVLCYLRQQVLKKYTGIFCNAHSRDVCCSFFACDGVIDHLITHLLLPAGCKIGLICFTASLKQRYFFDSFLEKIIAVKGMPLPVKTGR